MLHSFKSRQLFKFAAVFIIATALMIILLPANVSAAPPINEIEITISTDDTIVVTEPNTRLYTNGTATRDYRLTVDIKQGASVIFEADLFYNGSDSANFLTFTGSGGLGINGADISGSTSGYLVKVANSISSVEISNSSFRNTNSSSTCISLELNQNATLENVSVVADYGYALYFKSGTLTVTGSSNTITGGEFGLKSETSGAIRIENAQIQTTSSELYNYAIMCCSDLTLTNVTVDTYRSAGGIEQSSGNYTIRLTDCNISAYQNTITSYGDLVITDSTVTEKNAISYAVYATGNLTINEDDGTTLIETIKTVDGDAGCAVLFSPASTKTFTLNGGTIISDADAAVYISDNALVKLIGGEILFTGGSSFLPNGVAVMGDADVTFSGTEIRSSRTAVWIADPYADATFESGIITGENALQVNETAPATVVIKGGTFDGTNGSGIIYVGGSVKIAPASGKEVIVKGTIAAIYDSQNKIDYTGAPFAFVSEIYASNNRDTAVFPFLNNSAFYNIIFLGSVPKAYLPVTLAPEPVTSGFVPALPEANSVPDKFDFSYSLTYLEKHSNRLGTSYVNMDFSLTPNIRGNLVEDKTAVSALRASVRLAREAHQTEIFINVPEGTKFSDNFTMIKKILAIRYKMKITVKFAE